MLVSTRDGTVGSAAKADMVSTPAATQSGSLNLMNLMVPRCSPKQGLVPGPRQPRPTRRFAPWDGVTQRSADPSAARIPPPTGNHRRPRRRKYPWAGLRRQGFPDRNARL